MCQSLPCYRAVGGSVLGSVPAAGRSGHSQVWAVIHRSPTSSLCCYFCHGANWGGREDEGLRRGLVWAYSHCWGIICVEKKCDILHSELVIVAVREHTCVGEWEPATPEKGEDLMNHIFCFFCTGMSEGIFIPLTVWNLAEENKNAHILFFSFSP